MYDFENYSLDSFNSEPSCSTSSTIELERVDMEGADQPVWVDTLQQHTNQDNGTITISYSYSGISEYLCAYNPQGSYQLHCENGMQESVSEEKFNADGLIVEERYSDGIWWDKTTYQYDSMPPPFVMQANPCEDINPQEASEYIVNDNAETYYILPPHQQFSYRVPSSDDNKRRPYNILIKGQDVTTNGDNDIIADIKIEDVLLMHVFKKIDSNGLIRARVTSPESGGSFTLENTTSTDLPIRVLRSN